MWNTERSAPCLRIQTVPGSRVPRQITGRTWLSRFVPLIWERNRTERIFGFLYRVEIYVPQPQRGYGYYVFPFLLDGALVALVDLKAAAARGFRRGMAAQVTSMSPVPVPVPVRPRTRSGGACSGTTQLIASDA